MADMEVKILSQVKRIEERMTRLEEDISHIKEVTNSLNGNVAATIQSSGDMGGDLLAEMFENRRTVLANFNLKHPEQDPQSITNKEDKATPLDTNLSNRAMIYGKSVQETRDVLTLKQKSDQMRAIVLERMNAGKGAKPSSK